MRSILESTNIDLVRALSHILREQGIEHTVEWTTDRDWARPSYGDSTYILWITGEDDLIRAQTILSEVQADSSTVRKAVRTRLDAAPQESQKIPTPSSHPMTCAIVLILSTIYVLFFCFPSEIVSFPPKTPQRELFTVRSPIERALLFDYPKALTHYDEGVTALEKAFRDSPILTSLALAKIRMAAQTPFWPGAFTLFQMSYEGENSTAYKNAPIFEKISSGQIWRIWSPSLLHASLLHFAFNVMWVLLLLPAVESLFRSKRSLLLFLLLLAATSNTAQYLMSGFNFCGFSGVLCGLAGYLFKVGPMAIATGVPRGFRVHRHLLRFLQLFIFTLAGLSLIFFAATLLLHTPISFGVANTAHITGWFAGYTFRQNTLSTNRWN